MTRYFYCIAILLLFSGCTAVDEKASIEEPTKAIAAFYDALENFDYETARTHCAADFFAIENTKTYHSLDEFFEMVKTFEGADVDIDFEVEKAKMKAKSAVLLVRFKALVEMNGEKMKMESIESYQMLKEKQKWLIESFHSTYVKEEDPVHFKSMHLLKVPEKLSISILDEPLKEINAAIGEIGYPDCGYVIYRTTADHKSDYTHVFEGKWLSKANYDLIHEHEKYKEMTEKYHEKFEDLFAGQVYFKVEK